MSQRQPDDFMQVYISMTFNAKMSETAENPPPLDVPTEYSFCLPCEEETAEYLESIATAIRERRLFGFMQQEAASNPVGCGEWIENDANEKEQS